LPKSLFSTAALATEWALRQFGAGVLTDDGKAMYHFVQATAPGPVTADRFLLPKQLFPSRGCSSI
jgi:hypothetical protein